MNRNQQTLSKTSIRCSRQDLVEDLKGRMVAGELEPGDRLPTYDRLESLYGASRATLLNVIGDLKRDGFVISQERRGMFVTDALPCQNRFGLLIQGHESENRFWTRLTTEATKRTDGMQAIVYRNLLHANTTEWQELEDELALRRLGGVIFTHRPANHEALALAQRADVAKVIIAVEADEFPCSAGLHLSGLSFMEQAVDDLVSRGASRLAMITMGRHPAIQHYHRVMADRGLPMRKTWVQAVPRDYQEGAANVVRLLMDCASEYRPDGLLIADDNLTPHVVSGLVEHGVQASTVLPIVTHANLPDDSHWALPIRSLGFDCRDILHHALRMVRALADGQDVPDTAIPAVFKNHE